MEQASISASLAEKKRDKQAYFNAMDVSWDIGLVLNIMLTQGSSLWQSLPPCVRFLPTLLVLVLLPGWPARAPYALIDFLSFLFEELVFAKSCNCALGFFVYPWRHGFLNLGAFVLVELSCSNQRQFGCSSLYQLSTTAGVC